MKLNKTGRDVQLVGTSFTPVPPLKQCKDGPIKIIHQVHPNVLY